MEFKCMTSAKDCQKKRTKVHMTVLKDNLGIW